MHRHPRAKPRVVAQMDLHWLLVVLAGTAQKGLGRSGCVLSLTQIHLLFTLHLSMKAEEGEAASLALTKGNATSAQLAAADVPSLHRNIQVIVSREATR
ncbi:hypothetical protein EYF80_001622 [Liparis tanakae]|uniref:Secreted protein n=1 Tax=Liparis tanakae TaxID=230148 RepID=A0A4Z2JDE9_9TELE|nr:hypothetical protein EYF80_001622 [Liparis tanakae]